MFSMIKPTLAVVIALASASLALAEGTDSNPQNRYPHLAAPGGPSTYYELRQRGTFQSAPTGTVQSAPTRALQSAPAALRSAPTGALRSAPAQLHPVNQGRNAAPAASRNGYYGGQQDQSGIDLNDRASSPYAPGGGG